MNIVYVVGLVLTLVIFAFAAGIIFAESLPNPPRAYMTPPKKDGPE
jgi:hypothetical protein